MRNLKFIDKVFAGILILMFVNFFIFLYLWIIPLNPVKVTNIRITTPTVQAGSNVTYAIDYCKTTGVASQVYISIVNASIVSEPPIPGGRPAGCYKNITRDVPTPKNLSPGLHHLEVDIVYQFNPFHQYIYHYRTPDFDVTQNNDLSNNE